MADEGNDRATRQTQKQKQYVQKTIDRYLKRTTNDVKIISLTTQEEIEKDNKVVDFFVEELAIIEMIRREKIPHIQKPEARSISFTARKEIIGYNKVVEFFERELDNNNMEMICNNHLGYEHNQTPRLICNGLYKV